MHYINGVTEEVLVFVLACVSLAKPDCGSRGLKNLKSTNCAVIFAYYSLVVDASLP